MHCLFITPFNPYPVQSGGAILSDLMLERIGRRCPIDVATFGDSPDYSSYPAVRKVFLFGKNALYRLQAVFSGFPESLERHFNAKLNTLLFEGGYSHVFCDSFTPVLNLARPKRALGGKPGFRTVLLSHNIESRVERENIQFDGGRYSWHKRNILTRDVGRMERAEEAFMPLFDRVLSVSEFESREMRERCGCGENVRTLPLALRRKPSVKPGSRDGRTILFAGSMWWLPNRHGLAWFFEKCWGPVLAARPDARLVLAGNDKTGFAREMAGRYPNVTATGFVKDIDPFFREASVFILPLLIGTGIKIKLLEAMAWGLPVVSTPKGVEGVAGLVEERHVLARENPADFAKALVFLLENPAVCETMGGEGLAFTESNSMALESVIGEVFCDG